MLQPGSRLGNYHILRPIGSGGFATVYLGEHVYLKTMAAVKVLHVGDDMQQEDIDKFLREARTIAVLKHSHIVSILDFSVEKGLPYLIMDYAPNGSLSTRHANEPILDSKAILSYTMQVTEALQYAHDHKVVHCDVKPANMLLGQNNNVLLSDFGIAVVIHTSFKMSTVVGTMQYMSPEQFSGKPVAASDQYALAVCIYRWLCGRFPFDYANPAQMWHLQMNVPPPPLSQINPQISRKVEQVVLTALAKDPGQRFSSVSAFASALERAMQAREVLPPPVPMASPLILPVEESGIESEEPLALLPSFVSLLTSKEKKDLSVQPLSVPPTLSQSTEGAAKPLDLQADDGTQVAKPWWGEIMGVPDDSAGLLPESPLLPPLVLPSMSQTTPLSHLTYSQHTTWVSAITWSPDGTRLASASWDKTVHIWDAVSCKTLLVYREHTQPVKSVAWSPDGAYIASGAWSVLIWDVAKELPLSEGYRHKAQIEAVAWSPNGVYIASAGHDSKVRVWRAVDEYTFFVYEGHEGPVWSVAWSPDSKYIASASHDGTVQVWKALTGELVQVYRGHNYPVATVSWSYDGKLIASGDHDGWVHIWNNTDGDMVLNYRDETGAVKALNWSPLSMHLASAVKSVQVWDLTTTQPTAPCFTYTGHTDWVNALSWSPDGEYIASASDDKTVQIWEVR